MAELSAWRSRAGRAWPELAAVAAGREVVTYKELGERIGAHWRQIGRILEPIQAHCLANGLPPITILIVGASSGLPGDGFVAAGKEQVLSLIHI